MNDPYKEFDKWAAQSLQDKHDAPYPIDAWIEQDKKINKIRTALRNLIAAYKDEGSLARAMQAAEDILQET
jgi:hypothetical protein